MVAIHRRVVNQAFLAEAVVLFVRMPFSHSVGRASSSMCTEPMNRLITLKILSVSNKANILYSTAAVVAVSPH